MKNLATFLSLAFALAATSCVYAESDYVRVCYYTNWTQYRPGAGKFLMSDLDPFLCTHLIYSFIEIGTNNELKLREWNGEQLIADSMILKQTNPSLKISAAVGGWNFGTERFTAVCKDENTMRHFAKTSVTFLRKYEFDGLDIDWEYPGSRGSPPEDKAKFPRLIEIMLEEFNKDPTPGDRLMITAGVSGGDGTIAAGYEIDQLCQLLDYVHLMAYDYHGGSFEDLTGHNSPLYGNTGYWYARNFNVDYGLRMWLDGGCEKNKMVLGLPLYGRTFTLADKTKYGYNETASGPGAAGEFTREAGQLAYYEICPMISQGIVLHEPEVSAPALVVGDQWIGYDDKTSLRTKIQYMKDMGLAGTMIWAVEWDDFNALCGEKYPLMRTIYYELEGENSPACFTSPTTEAVTWWPDPSATDPPPTTVCWYPLDPDQSTDPVTPAKTTTTQKPVATTTEKPVATTTEKPVATTTEKPQPPPVTEAPVKTTTESSSSDGEYKCPSAGMHPDPECCQCYYNCDAGLVPHHYTCPEGTLFNSVTKTCDWAVNVKC